MINEGLNIKQCNFILFMIAWLTYEIVILRLLWRFYTIPIWLWSGSWVCVYGGVWVSVYGCVCVCECIWVCAWVCVCFPVHVLVPLHCICNTHQKIQKILQCVNVEDWLQSNLGRSWLDGNALLFLLMVRELCAFAKTCIILR